MNRRAFFRLGAGAVASIPAVIVGAGSVENRETEIEPARRENPIIVIDPAKLDVEAFKRSMEGLRAHYGMVLTREEEIRISPHPLNLNPDDIFPKIT